jgi:metal transporter CNNM
MFNYLIIAFLILLSALFSGLTLGLMTLNVLELKRKAALGNKKAIKVYEIRRHGNLILTTLLVGNVAVNSIVSIFLGSITSGFTAGLIATSLIVVLGEITPQAIFSRFALTLSAKMIWFVKIFIFILFPICWPIAWLLNKGLGNELPNIYTKKELMKIIEEHETSKESDIDADEERIIKGALTFSDRQVKDVMTPKRITKMIESSQIIDENLLSNLRGSSFSRIPVYKNKQDNIIGILYLTQLLGEKSIGKTVGQVTDKKVFFINENKKLDVTFKAFLDTHYHLFMVKNDAKEMVGIITLEDILEEIIRSEIMDERDKYRNLNSPIMAKQ